MMFFQIAFFGISMKIPIHNKFELFGCVSSFFHLTEHAYENIW